MPEDDLWRRLGQQFALLCCQEFPSALRCVGSTIQDFFGSLDCFHGHLSKAEEFQNCPWSPPFERCVARENDILDIQYATDAIRPMDMHSFQIGVIEQTSISVFDVDVSVKKTPVDEMTPSNFIGLPREGAIVQHYVCRVSVTLKPSSPAYKAFIGKVLNRHLETLSQVSFLKLSKDVYGYRWEYFSELRKERLVVCRDVVQESGVFGKKFMTAQKYTRFLWIHRKLCLGSLGGKYISVEYL